MPTVKTPPTHIIVQENQVMVVDSAFIFSSLGGLFFVTYVIPSVYKSWVDRWKVSRI